MTLHSQNKPEYSCRLGEIVARLRRAGLLESYRMNNSDKTLVSLIPSYTFQRIYDQSHDGDLNPATVGVLFYQGVQVDHHQSLPVMLKGRYQPGVFVGGSSLAVELMPENTSYIKVSCPRSAWPIAMDVITGSVQNSLSFIGITGTNGKTSTTWILHELMRQVKVPHLVIGTFGSCYSLGGEAISLPDFKVTGHTTPDPSILFPLLSEAVTYGVRYVIMEVSSHSLMQKKLYGIVFDHVAFTSFSRDHLDIHGTMDDYFQTKWQLFSAPYSTKNTQQWITQKLLDSDVFQKCCRKSDVLSKEGAWDKLQVINPKKMKNPSHGYSGHFMAENLSLAAHMASSILGIDDHNLFQEMDMTQLRPVPGRMHIIWRQPYVIIDYAHTPDAIGQALGYLKDIYQGYPLWVVFGCGGMRDQGKRAPMGRVATTLSDRVFLTSDNPRQEDPESIINDIKGGISPPDMVKVTVILDRREAIRRALREACLMGNSGKKRSQQVKTNFPVVLIAGKGHETTQTIGNKILEFSDQQVALDFFEDQKNHTGQQDATTNTT
ncbi:MAG: UDP-N-acetylmuramoyl-L-alanyl-D-glutamate--2,6-diaminopimelate ligase [Proteobacteria bacterium]|nr:UDP-N-acetylmuramoyl-L-alanyl-D-glutamate--2,6-diaminopimelate ligase [Pseudomonadota bacterium]